MSNIPAGFVRPFRADPYGRFIWDAENQMACEVYTAYKPPEKPYVFKILPRGWGRIQYLPNDNAQMDAWETWCAARVAGITDVEEAVRRLNDTSRD
jgi:hypothetical protein